jgi:hypothetical protein
MATSRGGRVRCGSTQECYGLRSAQRSSELGFTRSNAAVWHDDDMTGRMRSSTRTALVGLMVVSLAGSADVGEFLATRTVMFIDAPGRAAGSVLGLLFWLALLGIAVARYFGRETRWSSGATVGLAAVVAVGNVGLGLIHLKAGIGGSRPMLGAGLGVAAIILAVASRDPVQPAPSVKGGLVTHK